MKTIRSKPVLKETKEKWELNTMVTLNWILDQKLNQKNDMSGAFGEVRVRLIDSIT